MEGKTESYYEDISSPTSPTLPTPSQLEVGGETLIIPLDAVVVNSKEAEEVVVESSGSCFPIFSQQSFQKELEDSVKRRREEEEVSSLPPSKKVKREDSAVSEQEVALDLRKPKKRWEVYAVKSSPSGDTSFWKPREEEDEDEEGPSPPSATASTEVKPDSPTSPPPTFTVLQTVPQVVYEAMRLSGEEEDEDFEGEDLVTHPPSLKTLVEVEEEFAGIPLQPFGDEGGEDVPPPIRHVNGREKYYICKRRSERLQKLRQRLQ